MSNHGELVVLLPSDLLEQKPEPRTVLVRPNVRPEQLLPLVTELYHEARRVHRARVLPPVEKRFTARVSSMFVKQGREFSRRFARFRQNFHETIREAQLPAWEPEWHETSLAMRGPFEDVLRSGSEDALKLGGQAMEAQLGATFDSTQAAVVDYLRNHAAEQVTRIDETTRSALRDLIANGVEQGLSYSDMSRQIRDSFDGFAGRLPGLELPLPGHLADRAEVIAVHESALAYTFGQQVVSDELKAAGVELVKEWITAGDDLVDDDCQANEDAGPIPYDDTFPSGDDWVPAHIACRCDVAVEPAPIDTAAPPEPEVSTVSAALDVGSTFLPAYADRVQSALDVIDGLHGDGPLPTIPIEPTVSTGAGVSGWFDPGLMEMRLVGELAGQMENTVVHEVGHFIDHSGIGTAGVMASSSGSQTVAPWLDAIHRSGAYQELQRIAAGGDVPGLTITDVFRFGFVRDYLLTPEELWARSYNQWVTSKSGTVAMKEALSHYKPGGKAVFPDQWTDADFKGISKAFDSLFKDLGWLK